MREQISCPIVRICQKYVLSVIAADEEIEKGKDIKGYI
ncbi:hypothetical protein SAMN05216316_1808 [Nitrosovibrio sp. Nv6]|nr:hypothetical protein SAMN05216316_1808 [Nitrosovibrio sp. Nv6]